MIRTDKFDDAEFKRLSRLEGIASGYEKGWRYYIYGDQRVFERTAAQSLSQSSFTDARNNSEQRDSGIAEKFINSTGNIAMARNQNLQLEIAIREGALERAKAAISAGAMINPSHPYDGGWNGCPPLHRATANGQVEIVSLLIEKGAQVNQRDSAEVSALHCAIKDGPFQNRSVIAALLLDHGADHSAQRRYAGTPLHDAIWYGNIDLVRVLVERGADVNATVQGKDAKLFYKGASVLDLAVEGENKEIVEYLESKGAFRTEGFVGHRILSNPNRQKGD